MLSAGLSNVSSLSFKRSNGVTAEGMRAFANLIKLLNLDLEGCLKIHGGLIHLKDLKKLESLNLRYCNCIADSDIKYLAGSSIVCVFSSDIAYSISLSDTNDCRNIN